VDDIEREEHSSRHDMHAGELLPLAAEDRCRRARTGQLLRALGQALTLLANIALDRLQQDTEDQLTLAWRVRHKAGWQDRGEQLDDQP